VSVLKDYKTGELYRVPSRPNQTVRQIYQTFGLVRNEKIRRIEQDLLYPETEPLEGEFLKMLKLELFKETLYAAALLP
jgi:hypothetical protein